MAHEGLHESADRLSPETVETHRAILSLMEEFEAVDWYRQRADASADPELRAILIHHMNEEMEHAAMLLEWLRRRNAKLDEVLRTYLFAEGDITRLEEQATGAGESRAAPRFTVGDMKGA